MVPEPKILSMLLTISVAGIALDAYRMDMIDSVEYEDSVSTSSTVKITINDPDLFLLEDTIFVEETPVVITGGWSHLPRWNFEGYIAAIDIDYPEEGCPVLTITCMDNSYLMNRKEKKRTWDGMARSSVVQAICAEYGFTCYADESPEVAETLSQSEKTDIQFIMDMAGEDGFEVRICGNVLTYKKKEVLLDPWGHFAYRCDRYNLISFTPRITKAKKKESVEKSDINATTGETETGTADSDTARDLNGEPADASGSRKYQYKGAGEYVEVE